MSKMKNLKGLSKSSLFFTALIVIAVIILFIYIASPFATHMFTEETVKKVYFADHISPVYQELIKEFNEQNKGEIEIVPVHLPFEKFTTNERKEILSRYLRSNDIVDIVSIDQIWVPRFAKWAEPLDIPFEKYVKDSLLSIALKSCYYQGRLVSIPTHLDVAVLYYRSDLLKHLSGTLSPESKLNNSITWEEFIEQGELAAKLSNPFYIFQADDYEGLVCSFLEMLHSQGKDLYENGELRLDTPEAHKALQTLADFVHKNRISPPSVSELRENNGNNFFMSNNAIFLRGWPSFLKEFEKDTLHKETLKNLKIAALPHFKNGKPANILGGWNFMISKYSNHKPEAVKFVKFMLSRKVQTRMFEARNTMPVIKAIYQDKAFMDKEKNLAYFYRLLDNGFHRPFIEDYTKNSDIISYYLYKAVKNQITVDSALKSASEKIRLGQVLIR